MKITKLIAHFLLILAASNNNVNEANALPATTTASDHTFVNNKHHHRNTHRLNFGPNLDHRKYSAPSIREFGPLYYDPFYSNDPKKIAISFVEELHPFSDFVIKDIYKSDHTNVTHVYFKQVVNGLTVANGDLNVNVDSHGRVISFGDSFALPKRHSRSNQKCSSKLEKDNKNYFGFDDINGDDDDDVDNMASNIQVNQQFVLFPSKNKRKKVSIKGNAELYNIDYNPKPIISLYEALKSFASLLNIRAPDSSEITISTSNWLSGEPVFLIANVPFALSDVVAKQSYLQLDTDYQLQLIWELQIEMEHNWYHAHIDARNGVLLALIDWVADAAYNVFPLGVNDPSVGKRELLYDPNDIISSPYGWHYQSAKKNFTTTIGNNVYAQENFDGEWGWKHNYRPDGGEDLIFDFPLDLSKSPKTYINASITNLFYWNNIIHDLFYRYGFNEVAGNFQQKNHGKGGKDRDAVIANAQDGSGYNNANFATPPDGQHGKMRMYVWNVVNPYRDGDLESGIIVHEYSHGISTRLTGGPANSGCLGWGEAGGMGEGWGDFFATILRMKKEYNRTINFGMGEWANGDEGIRYYLYSTSLTTNPETYIYLDKPGYWGVHAKGAVWAEMLYEVYWNFVEKHGFTSSWFPPTDDKDNDWYDESTIDGTIGKKIPKHGNTLFLQLVVDGMKLQPCRPTFIDARDAILQADEILTGGQNKCEIWKGFAKRGLGVNAKLIGDSDWGSIRKENFDMPHACIQ